MDSPSSVEKRKAKAVSSAPRRVSHMLSSSRACFMYAIPQLTRALRARKRCESALMHCGPSSETLPRSTQRPPTTDQFTPLVLSNLKTAPSNTCAPLAQSSGELYSAGLCVNPSRHGTKIIAVGTRVEVCTLSWPAPLYMRCVNDGPSGPSKALALSSIQEMHRESNWATFAAWSTDHETLHGKPAVQPELRLPTSCPCAICSKSVRRVSSMAAIVSSLLERRSKLNLTRPGTVLVLPGASESRPVDASEP
jgi:hypothetical protein